MTDLIIGHHIHNTSFLNTQEKVFKDAYFFKYVNHKLLKKAKLCLAYKIQIRRCFNQTNGHLSPSPGPKAAHRTRTISPPNDSIFTFKRNLRARATRQKTGSR